MSRDRKSGRRRWVRNDPDRRETLGAGLVAGAVAAGVGVVTFYLARLFLAREPLDAPPGPPSDDGAERSGPGGA